MSKPTITIRHLDTPEAYADAYASFFAAIGFRAEAVAGEEFLIPLDEDHPEYAKCVRKLERAKRALATSEGIAIKPASDGEGASSLSSPADQNHKAST